MRAAVSQPRGTAERETALRLPGELPGPHGKTVGADRNYDARGLLQDARELGITPHVACNESGDRSNLIIEATTRHTGYSVIQCTRKQIEGHLAWGKPVVGPVWTMYRALDRVGENSYPTLIRFNLVRMRTLAFAAGLSG